MRPEFRGTVYDQEVDKAGPQWDRNREIRVDPRYDRNDPRSDRERERDYMENSHGHGSSFDGSGRYGARDPRPVQAYYD